MAAVPSPQQVQTGGKALPRLSQKGPILNLTCKTEKFWGQKSGSVSPNGPAEAAQRVLLLDSNSLDNSQSNAALLLWHPNCFPIWVKTNLLGSNWFLRHTREVLILLVRL